MVLKRLKIGHWAWWHRIPQVFDYISNGHLIFSINTEEFETGMLVISYKIKKITNNKQDLDDFITLIQRLAEEGLISPPLDLKERIVEDIDYSEKYERAAFKDWWEATF